MGYIAPDSMQLGKSIVQVLNLAMKWMQVPCSQVEAQSGHNHDDMVKVPIC